MPRLYTVTFEVVSVSAAQDLIQISGASGKVLFPRRIALSGADASLPTAGMLALRCSYLPATVMNGNGAAATPNKTDQGDPAASFSAIVNSTTPASTSATKATRYEDGNHLYGPFGHKFEDYENPIMSGEAFVFELINTPVVAVTLSCTMWVFEIGA